jgi:hypothetical protein
MGWWEDWFEFGFWGFSHDFDLVGGSFWVVGWWGYWEGGF